ncbi:MAG: hypothetical protein AB1665_00895 [Candidatus Thermoplasmatota archaeon]
MAIRLYPVLSSCIFALGLASFCLGIAEGGALGCLLAVLGGLNVLAGMAITLVPTDTVMAKASSSLCPPAFLCPRCSIPVMDDDGVCPCCGALLR